MSQVNRQTRHHENDAIGGFGEPLIGPAHTVTVSATQAIGRHHAQAQALSQKRCQLVRQITAGSSAKTNGTKYMPRPSQRLNRALAASPAGLPPTPAPFPPR